MKNFLKRVILFIRNKLNYLYRDPAVIAKQEIRVSALWSPAEKPNHNKKALYIDADTPTPDQNAGSIEAFNLMSILQYLGFEVTFVPESNFIHRGIYTENLIKHGIKPIFAPEYSSIKQLYINGLDFDLIILCRSYIGEKYIDQIKEWWPKAKIVFYTVDLHFLRDEREAALLNSSEKLKAALESRKKELAVIQKVDTTIILSEYEKVLLKEILPSCDLQVIPLIRKIKPLETFAQFDERSDLVFIGTYQHPPNLDGVIYFINEIWPIIHKRLPNLKFIVAGSMVPEELLKKNGHFNIEVVGYVPDLEEFLNKFKLSVAPLRYGAGIKGKISSSMEMGLPVIATSIAAEGMDLEAEKHYLNADDPQSFADQVIRIYGDKDLWTDISNNGYAHVEKRFGIESATEKIRLLVADVLSNDFATQREFKKLNTDIKASLRKEDISSFWDSLIDVNTNQILKYGFKNFKRTVNNNYYQWFPLGFNDPRFKVVFNYWKEDPDFNSLRIMADNGPFFNSKDVEFNRGWGDIENRIFDDKNIKSFYVFYISLLWNYARKNVPIFKLGLIGEPDIGNPFPIYIDGTLISQDLANSIIEWGAIREMTSAQIGNYGQVILELGAGYGRLAYVFLMAKECSRYIIVDINPALAISQVYLKAVFKNIQIFEFRDFNDYEEIREEFESSKLCFITPMQMEILPDSSIDIAITISSLHEMSLDIIKKYLNTIDAKTSKFLYSKQYLNWHNPIDNIHIDRDVVSMPIEWTCVLDRINFSNPEFIELGYKKSTNKELTL